MALRRALPARDVSRHAVALLGALHGLFQDTGPVFFEFESGRVSEECLSL